MVTPVWVEVLAGRLLDDARNAEIGQHSLAAPREYVPG